MTIQLVHFRDYYHCKNAYSHLDLESTNELLQRLRDYSKKRGAAPDLIIEFDTVGLESDLSTGVALYAVRSDHNARVMGLTHRFFLFFSFRNPAPRVTIKSREALAP